MKAPAFLLAKAEKEAEAFKEAIESGEERIVDCDKLFKVACDGLAEANHKRNDAEEAFKTAEAQKAEKEEALRSFDPVTRTLRNISMVVSEFARRPRALSPVHSSSEYGALWP